MSIPLRPSTCRNCGRTWAEDELDDQRWCASCRQVVIHRASLWARGVALLSALLAGLWVAFVIGPSTRFLIVWMVILAAIYVLVSKIVKRVAFEIIRARGVPTKGE
ncbi:hypothetical protein BH23GEM3_BH23GEM3_10800 [soil metagenome]